ncbi:MAG: argininosuccinate lyase [Desulfobacteraceae bacterium]|nr:argininosuccinate lyase [Desulfobacteraceae bacterium]
MSEKAWGGRFVEATARSVETFTASIDFDRRLYAQDIAGSIAHARMLAKIGVIGPEEAKTLEAGLLKVKADIQQGKMKFSHAAEDIHMHVEAALEKKVGKVALKLHTARSRNDQIALDVRLYLKEETVTIISMLRHFRKVLVDFAKANMDVILPGYTHLQRAQPILLAHHILAYYEMFTRDSERLSEALNRMDVMPLGAAALAGTTYPIDREFVAKELGFKKVSANSMDSVSDRDFIIEFLSAATLCMLHFTRISEELVLWSSSEFGFIHMPDAFSTGSSIMPQKKNPDVPELVRGKFGRVFGNLVALVSLMKSLPLAYNKDTQEDKEPMFDTVDTLKACIDIYCQMMPEIKPNRKVMFAAATTGYLNATDLADYLATKGMPFREAHHCAGKAVAYAIDREKELEALGLDELKQFSNLIEEDIYQALEPLAGVNRRISPGGTATKNVLKAVKTAEKRLEKEDRTRG